VAIFTALGLGGTWGMSFSIVRRIREATWIGIGFLALAAYRGFVRRRRPRPSTEPCAASPASWPRPAFADRAMLERMVRTLAHRGPDTFGFHVDGPAALALRGCA